MKKIFIIAVAAVLSMSMMTFGAEINNYVSAEDTNVAIYQGEVKESAYSTILYKNGNSVWSLAGGTVNPGNRIILQMIDNEGAAVIPLAEGEEPVGDTVELNISDGSYTGNIYNASGTYEQTGDNLRVNIYGSGSLKGDISMATYVHGVSLEGTTLEAVEEGIKAVNEEADKLEYVMIDAEGKETDKAHETAAVKYIRYPVDEEYFLTQVVNLIGYNGRPSIEVNVYGSWKVRGQSLITHLTIAEGASVYAELTEFIDGSLLLTPSRNTLPAGEYGGKDEE